MPTFEITAPDGSQHEVTGPEGATQEQALEKFKAQWTPTQAKAPAATTVTTPTEAAPKPKPTLAATAAAGALGGATGALVMPWALIGGGALLTATGPGAIIGEPMAAAGLEMLAAQTATVGAALATAVGGAALGAVSAPAGQLAESAAAKRGASPSMAGAAGAVTELATGLAAGGAWGVAKSAALDAVPAVFRPVMKAYHALTEAGAEAGTSLSAAVEKARAALQSPALKDQPQHILHTTLQTAAEAHSKAADSAALAMEQKAKDTARGLLAQGQQKATAITAAGMAEEARIKAAGGQAAVTAKASRLVEGSKVQAQHEANAAKALAEAKASAQSVLEKAHADAAKVRSDAQQRQAALDKASQGKAKTAAAVQKLAQPELLKVGTPETPSKIGEPLERAMQEQKTAASDAREKAFTELKVKRDAAVAAKENAGQFVSDLPETKALVNEVAAVTLETVAGQKAATRMINGKPVLVAESTEPGILNAYREAFRSLRDRTVEGPDGSPVTAKLTFNALNEFRRKLGDAMMKDATGAASIYKGIAQKMYKRVSEIQEKYVGENGLQKQLQESYSTKSGAVEAFEAKRARWAMSDDTSVAGIPKAFFRDREGVRMLKDLTKQDELVNRAASDYLAGKMQGQNAAQVRKLLDNVETRDWLEELPSVQSKAEAYQKSLQAAEDLMARRTAVAGKLTAKAEQLQKAGATELGTAEKLARRGLGEGKAQAAAVEKAGTREAKVLAGEGQKAKSLAEREAAQQAKLAESQAAAQARAVQQQTKADAAQAVADAGKAAGQTTKEAAVAAKALRADAQAKVDTLQKSGSPVEAVEKLINNEPDLAKLVEIGKTLRGTKGGTEQWSDAMKRVVVKKSPTGLANWWETRGRDVATAGGATAQQLQELETGVKAIVDAATPQLKEQLKKRFANSLLKSMGAVMGAGLVSKLP